MGKWLIITGVTLVVIGLLWNYVPGMFKWFGNLPGDIRVENENSRFFFPLTSLIVISVVLTLLVNIFRYLKK